tara:strand:- start:172 stop:546 length:375 start_codon:yes stop_codon:yes gene_type:complete
MKRIYLFLLIVISLNYVSCYEDPFYKLNVFVVDQELNLVENADVIISVQNDLGEIVEDATVYHTSTTDVNGLSKFEFENLGFFSIQVQKIIFEPDNIICGTSSVSLEENTTKEITILATEPNCN